MTFAGSRISLLVALSLCAAPAIGRAAGLFDGLASDAKPVAGKEVRILDSDVGGKGYYTLYLPSDYKQRGSFPIIFNYHGQFEDPRTTPFRELTGGRGYIIVGMEYAPIAAAPPGAKPAAGAADPWTPSVNALRRIAASLRSELKIDPKLAYVAGFGAGAQQAQEAATHSAELWAGMIILGAGAPPDAPPSADFAGKAILVAAGENDSDHAAAQQAADAYKKLGAVVTFETFAGKGHVIDASDPVLKQWLVDNGPGRQVLVAMTAGRLAQKEGRLGAAYTQFASIAELHASPKDAQIAQDAAQAIADKASSLLAAGRRAMARHDDATAAQTLTEVKTTYDGSVFGRDAAGDLNTLGGTLAGAAAIAQAALDRQANIVEAQADALEKTKQYDKAMLTYQFCLAKFPTSHRAAAVRAKLSALQSNPTIRAGIEAAHADTDCHSWLSLADSFIRSGLPDKARPYLQKIIDTYGNTQWADQARDRLKQLDSGM